MRRLAPVLLGLLLAVAAAAGEPLPPLFEDALPPVPSVQERLDEIRRRVLDAVVYPEFARRRGVEGVTHIRFLVSRNGRAEEVETVASSGSPTLDQAAERGARDARGLPWVFGRVELPIRFALED